MSTTESMPPAGGAHMPCPHCRVDLVMSERQGIEIDYCPKCRGIWLDRGELDKLIERSEQQATAMQPQAQPSPPPPGQSAPGYSPWTAPTGAAPAPGWGPRRSDHDDDDDDHRYRSRRHRRQSWLGQLFDD